MTTQRRHRLQALTVTMLAAAVLAVPLRDLVADLRRRRSRRAPGQSADGGYATETVIVTALLVAAAITIIGIIVAKVLAKAKSISM